MPPRRRPPSVEVEERNGRVRCEGTPSPPSVRIAAHSVALSLSSTTCKAASTRQTALSVIARDSNKSLCVCSCSEEKMSPVESYEVHGVRTGVCVRILTAKNKHRNRFWVRLYPRAPSQWEHTRAHAFVFLWARSTILQALAQTEHRTQTTKVPPRQPGAPHVALVGALLVDARLVVQAHSGGVAAIAPHAGGAGRGRRNEGAPDGLASTRASRVPRANLEGGQPPRAPRPDGTRHGTAGGSAHRGRGGGGGGSTRTHVHSRPSAEVKAATLLLQQAARFDLSTYGCVCQIGPNCTTAR